MKTTQNTLKQRLGDIDHRYQCGELAGDLVIESIRLVLDEIDSRAESKTAVQNYGYALKTIRAELGIERKRRRRGKKNQNPHN